MKPLPILALIALSACTQKPVRIAVPPAQYLTCAPLPPAPDLPERDGTAETQNRRDLLMLDGYLSLRSAYGSCKASVDGVRAWAETVE